jgi:lysozyme
MSDWKGTAIELIKKFEGLRLEAYPDPASGGDPWTIGYGATGPEIQKGTVWTQDQADADLSQRIEQLGRQVDVNVFIPITDNQKAALVSFAYNVGINALVSSTLLKLVNQDDMHGAADEFPKWIHAAGKVMSGLVARRAAEQATFLEGL